MPARLSGKVGIVTGAASGISRETALLFSREGARVTVADVDSPGGEETVRMAKESGGGALYFKTDVSQASQVERLVNETLDAFGQLDILVNGAGAQIQTLPLAEVSEEEWDQAMDLYLKGSFLCCKYAIPAMIRGGGGSIVNISSVVVLRGSTFSLPYSVSKAGVVQLTKTASSQYCSRGIRVNCVIPGWVDTPGSRRVVKSPAVAATYDDGVPVGRIGQPEDIARLILYLASDESSYVAGSSFVIDGGISAQ
ncbi:MAG: SDR family NAD(P)-dependent oxidoreductase [Dehalococcoidia bacterium]